MAVKYYKGKYYQGSLKDEIAEKVIHLRDNCEVVPSLKKSIVNLTPTQIDTLIKHYEESDLNFENIPYPFMGVGKDIVLGELRDAQTVGVAFMYYVGSALLGDAVGLGKTVQLAGLINVLKNDYKAKGKEFRYCFLTESDPTLTQIRKKLIQFTGEYVGVLNSAEKKEVTKYIKNNKTKHNYSITGTHSLLNSAEFLIDSARKPFDLLIIDESSILKKTSSGYYKGAKELRKYVKDIILLNATPLEIEAKEFYTQLDFLDNWLPTLKDFYREFCVQTKGIHGFTIAGYKDNVSQFKEAVSLRYLARTRASLDAEYENNEYKTILIPLSKEQKDLMTRTTLYQLAADYPPAVDRKIPFTLETTPKIAVTLKLLEELGIKDGKDKAYIYTRYKDCQKAILGVLEESGYLPVIINGDTKKKQRDSIINDFNSGLYNVLITNIQTGLDLQGCDTCIMYTIDKNPQKMVQVEGRMTRELDVKNKNLFLLVAMGKEKNNFETKLKERVDASISFTTVDKSMVIQALSNGENKIIAE